jgi:hypothetical protein
LSTKLIPFGSAPDSLRATLPVAPAVVRANELWSVAVKVAEIALVIPTVVKVKLLVVTDELSGLWMNPLLSASSGTSTTASVSSWVLPAPAGPLP